MLRTHKFTDYSMLSDDHHRGGEPDSTSIAAPARERLQPVRREMYRSRAPLVRQTVINSTSQDEGANQIGSDSDCSLSSSESSLSSSDKGKGRKVKKGKPEQSKKMTRQGHDQSVLELNAVQEILAGLSTKGRSTDQANLVDDSVLAPVPAAPADSRGSSTKRTTVDVADIAQQVFQILQKQMCKKETPPPKSGSKIAFKRVDQVYDCKTHNYKLKETVQEDEELEIWDQYIFNVRRQFDSASNYVATFVDIKSTLLKECLREIMGEIKGINLVAEQPELNPNMLFMYLEELRTLSQHHRTQSKESNDHKQRKHAKLVYKHLDMLVKYLDEEYAATKKNLYPMLEAGIISFEYMWALFKPNTICYATAYGDEDEPRAFKISYSQEVQDILRGTFYSVEGRSLEYNGKQFGMASITEEIRQFSGTRRIDTLSCYPITYHKQRDRVTAHLIERGKKFITLQGMNYKTYAGMAYVKKEQKVLKVDVNGRIMIDPAVFRRVQPNYSLARIYPRLDGHTLDMGQFGEQNSSATTSDSPDLPTPSSEDFDKRKQEQRQRQFRVVRDDDGRLRTVEIKADESLPRQASEQSPSATVGNAVFSEEQLLTASPLVVGFSFSEKLWLEFAVSKVGEVQWNDGAFESLILPDKQKSIVEALVSSHAFHPSRSVDDIIAGKGRGLVAVLHGGPGLGKTLTVESVADLLRRPLYTVSAGDLGTSGSTLERELQTILDIAHAWGAVLLLDEADVFLEKRSTHDLHRNALVSIFLRLLEYFQGILFLTTNRVEVFDDAFISRIHLSLRYGELSPKAKKAVWSTFIQRVRDMDGMQVERIQEKDLDDLSRRVLNGRQIKNIVRAAQALAIHEDTPLGMNHIRTVLDVTQTFERDLRGGTGYEDAMRGYS